VIDAPISLELLDKTSLFRGISPKALAPILEQSVLISLKQGELLLSPGVNNEHVYIINSGRMGVHLTLSNLEEPFAVLKPGECVGEMSVLVDSEVSAYVIAITDCQLLAIGYSSFWSLIKGSNESARNMLNILVQRIRMGNEVIADTLLRDEKFSAKKTVIDRMTGLYNHHGIQERFDRMLQLRTIGKQPHCLVLLKVDETKSTQAGDRELGDEQPIHTIAQAIMTSLRQDDCAARLGGNTFAILLDNLPLSEACATAERLRAAVCQIPIRLPDGSSLPPVTLSAGVCKANEADTWSTLLTSAHQALDRAIHAGRNRISD
jgi:diguanylate cyclase (GGDEF)-like protein